ncbi:MAG: Zn-ribbon domain-containing OB-fold protein [Parahaliea sp.]
MRGLGADDPYWEALGRGELSLQSCSGCKKWNWPPVFRCGECGSWEQKWKPRPLYGTVYSWTRTWHDFGAPARLVPPFASVLVEVDGPGSVRLLGIMEASDADKVSIGQNVEGSIGQAMFQGETVPVIEWRNKAST